MTAVLRHLQELGRENESGDQCQRIGCQYGRSFIIHIPSANYCFNMNRHGFSSGTPVAVGTVKVGFRLKPTKLTDFDQVR